MKYLVAAIVVAAAAAALSVAFPRLAPIALRIGVVILIFIAAAWAIEYILTRPPRLASRVYETLKAKGPATLGELAREMGESPAQIEKALSYLEEKGLVRRIRKGEFDYFDVA